MKEKGEKLIGQRERDDAALNFVCLQAQEAILDPDVPESYKDFVLDAAIKTIRKVAERKATYFAKHGEGRRARRPQTIYKSKIKMKSEGKENVFYVRANNFEHIIYEARDNKKSKKDTPQIIEEINEYFNSSPYEELKISVERMAEGFGINRKILYEWVKTDPELSGALKRFKKIQEDDPFKTDTVEDIQVGAMLMALILGEARERHYKSSNL